MDTKKVDVMVADASHEIYVDKILDTIREAAKVRGTGIAERTHEYVATKMKEGKAIIMISAEMEELMGMSDRIVVLSEGNMTGLLEKNEFNQEIIMTYASAARM